MKHWYALKCRDELLTVDYLREANCVAYVPCERVNRKLGRREHPVSRPACPGYVFVLCATEAFTAVRAIGASDDFVRYTDPLGARVPLRLAPDALVPIVLAELFGDLDYTREPKAWEPKRGDQVKVTRGIWKGYVGAIVSIGKARTLIETKWCKMEIGASDLELAAA